VENNFKKQIQYCFGYLCVKNLLNVLIDAKVKWQIHVPLLFLDTV